MRLITILIALDIAGIAQGIDLSSYVLTDTGTSQNGNNFPGVSRPFGMVKLGPDLYTGHDAYSGYQDTGNFTGFSMPHLSGTGGVPKYGIVSQMPVVGEVLNPLSDDMNDTRALKDVTEVGYYKATLGSGAVVELAATNKAGLYQYTFPETDEDLNILVDVSHVLSSYRGQGLEQHFLGGDISVHPGERPGHYYYTGSGTYDNGWNRAKPWTIYFCGYFDAPASFKTFLGRDLTTSNLEEFSSRISQKSSSARLGAVFTVNTTRVVSRVGVSFISQGKACENVNSEIPEGTSLSRVRNETRDTWNKEVLNKVTTTDRDQRKLNQLYTSLYFMHLLPTNKTGENPLWKSEEPYYDDIYTFWDTHRSATPLLHILQPTFYEELIRSLIDIWRHDGWLPDARSSSQTGVVQGGSNADNVLADAYIKGVRGSVNWDDGFAAMVKDAEVTPPDTQDPRDRTGGTAEGRSALPDWLEHGFISTNFSRSVSRAVEYSVNDFALATVAAGLGNDTAFTKYLKRSRNWRNHWNPDSEALGFSGFLGPIDGNTQDFQLQNPLDCGGCYWRDAYYQALPWEYSFNAHHDMAHLIDLCGGPDTFAQRLETTFEPGAYAKNAAFGSTIFDPGNEPSFMTPYLYNFVNRQDLSVKRSRFIAGSYFAPTPNGLPGNGDSGAMESWLLWNMIGLYPVTGQTTFLIGSPWFSNLTISLRDGKVLQIKAVGGSKTAIYVQSLKVNGKPWNKSWLCYYDIFAEGGTLEFELGETPARWTTGELPPSPAGMTGEDAKRMLTREQLR